MRHVIRAAAIAVLATSATVGIAAPAFAESGSPATATVAGEPGTRVDPAPAGTPVDPAPAGTPVDPTTEYLNAFDTIAGAWADDSTVGQVVGTAAGLAVGCPLGAITGGTLTIPVPVLTPIGVVGGCILGAGTLGFLGGMAGGIVTGGPSLANAVGDQYNSLHSKGLIAQSMPADGNAR
ncbi:hypothetical protein [Nocardia cerradoensis]|uniref:Uncharacterized protein n=1 Tax=Nocardia cerradoensis TaxID=85688 RepID=A0A231H7Y9_9NOCA|nr:hypothetical protein [Nocardia cerradoensis]NKY44458.1 hypothetical protein [Nocardia cerradoensis]OXR44867.1 hypothetical protein B7C42_02821 [Nocardia cerradoensis]